MLVIDEKNIRIGLKAHSRDDCIRRICAVMAENGYVGEDYADAVIVRENEYPTGLPTEGVTVAIPHSNKGRVFRTGAGVAVLDTPVGFYNMADHESLLMAEIVFVLANSDPDKQLDDLGTLMDCCSDAGALKEIRAAKTGLEIVEILKNFEPD
ncbi:MAG: PTS sugar transporter subunit IIA [Oscillospiraceae bacterium]|nr:PTS sugar transporter subunit IIA [Oscillospiraceae bacterium]